MHIPPLTAPAFEEIAKVHPELIEDLKSCVVRQFERLEHGICGRMEDPAEDVFLSLVNTTRGNFRIFEGLLEGAGFYLQRILRIVEDMPDGPPFENISNGIRRMLQVSDAIAARASLCENSLGQEIQVEALPKEVIERLASAKKLIEFGDQALTVLQWELGCMITIVPRTGQAYRSDNSVEAATGRCLLVAEVCRCHSICEKSGGSGNKN